MILTLAQARSILNAHREGKRAVTVSLDLGRTTSTISLARSTTTFPQRVTVSLEDLAKVKEKACYLVTKKGLTKTQFFSEATGRLYKLEPTATWPTLTLSGVPMHSRTRLDPKRDAEAKLRHLDLKGAVLDTCTGLGYTAILAAKTAGNVVTVEKDPNVLAIAKLNPYSQELFTLKNIELRRGDVNELIRSFPDNRFDAIIHDPPTFSLAGELYSATFSKELRRVLKPNHKLFHYTGRVGIHHGRNFPAEVTKRLKTAGFTNLTNDATAAGIIATK